MGSLVRSDPMINDTETPTYADLENLATVARRELEQSTSERRAAITRALSATAPAFYEDPTASLFAFPGTRYIGATDFDKLKEKSTDVLPPRVQDAYELLREVVTGEERTGREYLV